MCDKIYDYFRSVCDCEVCDSCGNYESKVWVVVIGVDLFGGNVGVLGVGLDL